jgi:hypothetical protein
MYPIHQRILEINAQQSARFVADESARKRYLAQHPTMFSCIKCMDGRVHFPIMTKTPVGIIQPFRAIGGKFEIWWPSFLGRMRSWVEDAERSGRRNAVFVTYHYSFSDPHLGCAGWKYDTDAARIHAEQLAKQLGYVFGEQMDALVAGVETDRDLLTLHGLKGDLSGDILIGKTDEEIRNAIQETHPELLPQTREDLLPFLKGNAEQVAERDAKPRTPVEKAHNERIIAVGQGFDWLAEANLALIINDADPNLAESIRVAGSLILKNLQNAAPGDDATLLTNVPYTDPGMDQRQAIARSRGLKVFAERVLKDAYPELVASGRLHAMATIKWAPSKKIEVLEET